MRIVLDTGVVVSRLLRPESVPAQAVRLAFQQGEVIVSRDTLEELILVLDRPKFAEYLDAAQVAEFIEAFASTAEVVEVTAIVAACRDADDDKFLALAQSGAADIIVTGDADLLALHPFHGVEIISPRAFVDRSTKSLEGRRE